MVLVHEGGYFGVIDVVVAEGPANQPTRFIPLHGNNRKKSGNNTKPA